MTSFATNGSLPGRFQHVRVHRGDECRGRNPLFKRGHEASGRVDGDTVTNANDEGLAWWK